MRLLVLCAVAGARMCAQRPALDFLNHNRPVLDAHNCYPYQGRWTDRIDRALKTGFPVAIEQDSGWAKGRPVVSHTDKTTSAEPTLREHFFERVRPIVEKALVENDRARWPLIILHFDFKSNEPEVLRGVWDLLGEYESWITTAPATADPRTLAPFDPKPRLVLTEDSDAQEAVSLRPLKPGAKLRLFGSAHTAAIRAESPEQRTHLIATLTPAQLLAERPSNYRRWWNSSWYAVEEGGQPKAGDWTLAAAARLQALVDHAHRLGYWIRFYTLDGFAPTEDLGWGNAYNFGSRAAVEARWKAALAAGVNLIATDQYEDLAAFMRR